MQEGGLITTKSGYYTYFVNRQKFEHILEQINLKNPKLNLKLEKNSRTLSVKDFNDFLSGSAFRAQNGSKEVKLLRDNLARVKSMGKSALGAFGTIASIPLTAAGVALDVVDYIVPGKRDFSATKASRDLGKTSYKTYKEHTYSQKVDTSKASSIQLVDKVPLSIILDKPFDFRDNKTVSLLLCKLPKNKENPINMALTIDISMFGTNKIIEFLDYSEDMCNNNPVSKVADVVNAGISAVGSFFGLKKGGGKLSKKKSSKRKSSKRKSKRRYLKK